MLDIPNKIKALLKDTGFSISNSYDRIIHVYSFLVMVIASALLTYNGFVGENISCYSTAHGLPNGYLNTVCWNKGTFIKTSSDKIPFPGEVGTRFPDEEETRFPSEVQTRPGIGLVKPGDEVNNLTYYKWTWLFFLLQALLMMIPHWLWTHLEGGVVESLCISTDRGYPDLIKNRRIQILEFLTLHESRSIEYLLFYIFYKILSILALILTVHLTNNFLDGKFWEYGINVYLARIVNGLNIQDALFPLASMCKIPAFGYSGSIVTYSAVCELTNNDLNRKIFLFLWLWMAVIVPVTALVYLVEIILITCPCFKTTTLRAKGRIPIAGSHVLKNVSLRQAFVLIQIRRNLNSIEFRRIAEEFLEMIESDV